MIAVSLIGNVIGILFTGIISWLLGGVFPSIAGLFGGMSVCLALSFFIEQKYGHLTIGSIVAKTTVQKMGIWPAILLGTSAILLIYGLFSTSYVFSFLGTIAFVASFMFASLAVIARNPETSTRE